MARVHDIIFCMRTLNAGEGVTLNTVLSAITPEYVPGLFSFSIFISLLDISNEGEHTFSIEFIAPNGEKVVEIENQVLPIEILDGNGNLPNEYKGINIAMDWNNVNFKCDGLYTIKVYYDRSEAGEKKIYVKGKNE